MNILVIGSGGREHALCWKIAQSPLTSKLYCAPGNGGIAQVAECTPFDVNDFSGIVGFCKEKSIELVVVGPEVPLVAGISDVLEANGIAVFGPSAQAAQLEGSKGFTKELCAKYNIPTARYGRFTDFISARDYIQKQPMPIVVKADGLAAGKGVIIAETEEDAIGAVADIFNGRFGKAGLSVVVEEFMEGEELSFFALVDGETVIECGSAQDHKRVGEGDTGPNTGGMGTYAPAPVATRALCEEIMEQIICPAVEGMAQEGHPYRGVLFAGIMLTSDGPQLLEFNARFGDPETQVLMARMASDIVPLLRDCAKGELAPDAQVFFSDEAALCVVMAANGYPGDYEKGSEIRGLDQAGVMDEVTVFHAGTTQEDGRILATGGRVLGVTALGPTVADAQAKAYAAVDAIDWPQGFCRRDIGWRAIEREESATALSSATA